MQQIFKDFHLTRKARAGALTLLIILTLLILVWRILPVITKPKVNKDEIALQTAWSKFQKKHIHESPEAAGASSSKPYYEDEAHHAENKKSELFPFNPNTASEDDLLRLGLPKYTVNTILKFRAKNPTAFKKKEDLQRLYTLKKEDYERIVPYVRIPESENAIRDNSINEYPKQENYPSNIVSAQPTIELNSADANQLMSLRGIGPGYSKRIINFRDALGGFYKVEQLKEVYGFPDTTYLQLRDKFTVNSSLVRKINVNIADETTLGKQLYIERKLAANIIKVRNEIGQFKDLEQLKQVPLINEEKYRKIAPYLSTH